MIDIDKLKDGLNRLTGYDMEKLEAQERKSGTTYPDLSFTKSFQARVAARALGIPLDDLKALPAKEYNKACQTVATFLFSTTEEDENPSEQ